MSQRPDPQRRPRNPQLPPRASAAPGPAGRPQRPVPGQRPSGGQPQRPRRPAPQRAPEPRKPRGPEFRKLILPGLLILGSVILLILCLNIARSPVSEPSIREDGPAIEGFTEAPEQEKKPFWGKKETEAPETTQPEAQIVASAKVSVTGDLLIHRSLFNATSAVYQGEGKGYNFDSLFKYVENYTNTTDYAIANLETTLFGPGRPYSGNPKFNTPDELVDSAKKAGFDMLLTANNHCNDTDLDGILRTLKVVREKGLQTLGTNLTTEEEKYVIQEVNGIKLGMLCYTYEDSRDPNLVTFNYNPLAAKGKGLVCAFPKFQDAKSRDPFYEELSGQITEMKEQGAQAIVLFVHWGEEYHLEASRDQKDMAQRFCDLGVDLIVGGHPHVVQPVELLTSTTDPEHKTVCLYSLGNAVSNQRQEEMETSCPTGHTEDGMLFNFTFHQYSDGSVRLGSVEVIPTWVNMFSNADGKREYNILPLDQSKKDQWESLYGLTPARLPDLDASYQRTMDIVGTGLTEANAYLSGNTAQETVPASDAA